ncbi:MAG: hypothetical protein WCJ30_26555, partial [Deltaproteobacteria bacterium]
MKIVVAHLGALDAAHRHPRHRIPMLRAGYAASVLRAGGHSVELIDTAVHGGEQALRLAVRRARPDVLLIDPRIENYTRVGPLARDLGDYAGSIIAAGAPAESKRRELLPVGGPLRAVLGGEYEGIVEQVVAGLAANAISDIPGCTSAGALGPREGPQAVPIADIDALPMPPHDEYARSSYEIRYPVQVRNRVKPAFVLSTRGCPHACTFCSPVEMRSRFLKYRMRDVTGVLDELAWVERLGANTVYFN